MKLQLFPEHRCVVFEIHAEGPAEQALLNHLGTGHEAALCEAAYYVCDGTLRLLIKNQDAPAAQVRRRRPRKRNRK